MLVPRQWCSVCFVCHVLYVTFCTFSLHHLGFENLRRWQKCNLTETMMGLLGTRALRAWCALVGIQQVEIEEMLWELPSATTVPAAETWAPRSISYCTYRNLSVQMRPHRKASNKKSPWSSHDLGRLSPQRARVLNAGRNNHLLYV